MWSKPDGLFKHRGLGSMSGFGVSGLGIYKRGFVREKAPFSEGKDIQRTKKEKHKEGEGAKKRLISS